MAEPGAERRPSALDAQAQTDVSERALGRAVALGLPAAAIVTAVSLGLTLGVGPALLVLAGGAILGTISLLWASIRTLSGDAPLAESFSTLAGNAATSSGGAGERKRAALRALKDLDFEHSVGKIDDEDYSELVARYRGEAKALMREMDVEIEPLRDRAEQIAREYLAKRGLDGVSDDGADDAEPANGDSAESEAPVDDEPERGRTVSAAGAAPSKPKGKDLATDRIACSKCATSNEPDAGFCKKCGTLLRKECAACRTKNEPDAAFCKKCGARLTTDAKENPDAAS